MPRDLTSFLWQVKEQQAWKWTKIEASSNRFYWHLYNTAQCIFLPNAYGTVAKIDHTSLNKFKGIKTVQICSVTIWVQNRNQYGGKSGKISNYFQLCDTYLNNSWTRENVKSNWRAAIRQWTEWQGKQHNTTREKSKAQKGIHSNKSFARMKLPPWGTRAQWAQQKSNKWNNNNNKK